MPAKLEKICKNKIGKIEILGYFGKYLKYYRPVAEGTTL